MNESRPEKARAGWLERITNLAILGTLLILLLNPSGPIGSRVSRQVAETRERRTIENLWGGLTAPQSDVGDEQAAAGAPIIVEFLDYQCPACKAVAPAVAEAWKKGTATIVIRHLPLEEIHPLAREAALAVVCAERQGRLRAAHEALIGDGDWVPLRDWLGMAEKVGIGDLARFAECLGGHDAEQRLANDLQLAAALGIASTPTFVTPQGIYRGTGGFQAALDGILKQENDEN